MHHDKASAIPTDALTVLSAGRCDGDRFYLPAGALDRKLYESVNKVLTALGGKWNTKAKAHVFGETCEPLIEGAIETGSYVKPGDMGWFPTPAETAESVIDLANIEPGMDVLEPSVGEGALADLVRDQGGIVTAYEIDPKRAYRASELLGVDVDVCDFLAVKPQPKFARVVMNPPFAQRADVKHVLHAIKFLKPGGRLVSIMSAGILFRTDALATTLRDQLDHYEALPDDSFKASGTSVRTAVVVFNAPTE
jgi:predicted RNA methylase